MKKEFEERKIWIEDAKAFYKVQDTLIANGYSWWMFDTKKIKYDDFRSFYGINVTCVFTCPDGDICRSSFDRKEFNEDCRKEYTTERVLTISYNFKEVVPVVREKVAIGDKEYYLDELEVALTNIKPI